MLKLTQRQRPRTLAGVLLAFLVALPFSAEAQVAPQRVYVRQVRVDSFLVAFGVDSVRLRALVTEQLRDGNRLAPEPVADTPAFDVDIGVGRSVVGPVEPTGWVRIEVGRNRMEAGTATRLLWQGGESLSSRPTMRATAAATTSRVVELVRAFLADRPPGT